jgi:hypothetical protein
MRDYSSIDAILSAWAVKNKLRVLTHYKDEEVRYVIIYGPDGRRKADLWIDLPSESGVGLHLAEYGRQRREIRRRADVQSRASRMESDLDGLIALAVSW